MKVVDLGHQPESILEQAAALMVDHFDGPTGWDDLVDARREVRRILAEGFGRSALDGDVLIGWVGGLPEYDGRVIELHPLVVRRESRREGVGRALVEALEEEARRRGAFTITLGTDDDTGMTSLTGADLYADIPGQIANLHDLGRGHPFLFYLKLGFVVTGVMPDANGLGRPDIFMSKRVKPVG